MKTLREMMDLIESAQTVAEMDSQGYTGTRDDYEKDRKYKGPVGTGKSVTPKKVVKDLSKDFEKIFDKEKDVKEETEVDPVRRVEELFRNVPPLAPTATQLYPFHDIALHPQYPVEPNGSVPVIDIQVYPSVEVAIVVVPAPPTTHIDPFVATHEP